MKNLEKKPFEECKIELIELSGNVLTASQYWSEGGGYHPPEEGETA